MVISYENSRFPGWWKKKKIIGWFWPYQIWKSPCVINTDEISTLLVMPIRHFGVISLILVVRVRLPVHSPPPHSATRRQWTYMPAQNFLLPQCLVSYSLLTLSSPRNHTPQGNSLATLIYFFASLYFSQNQCRFWNRKNFFPSLDSQVFIWKLRELPCNSRLFCNWLLENTGESCYSSLFQKKDNSTGPVGIFVSLAFSFFFFNLSIVSKFAFSKSLNPHSFSFFFFFIYEE